MTALSDRIYNEIQDVTQIDNNDLAEILTALALSEHTIADVADFTLAASTSAALTAIGLGTGDSPTFTGLTLTSLTVDTDLIKVFGGFSTIGIGTATPSTNFEVALASKFTSTLALAGTVDLSATLYTSGSGRVILGDTTARSVGALAGVEDLQVNGTGNRAGISAARWSNDTSGPRVTVFHSRGTSAGTYTSLQNGDTLGGYYFAGANGSTYLEGAAIRALASGTPGASDMTSDLAFSLTSGTTLAEKARLTAAGRLLVGHTATVATVSTNPYIQTHVAAGIGAYRWTNDTGGALLFLTKSRSTTVGTYGTIVQSGDEVGVIYFAADDGVVGRNAASIRALVDGTPGSADMPGALVFSTVADGGSTLLDRMKIDSAGLVTFGDTDTGILGYGLTNALAVYAGGSEQMRLNTSALLHGGTVAATTVSTIPGIQSHGTGGVGVFKWSADANPAYLFLSKSRSTTKGTYGTIVQSGDQIGAMYFGADDGNASVSGAAIIAIVDGTPGLTDMPTRLSFYTAADGSSSVSESLRLTNAGAVYLPRISTTASAANAYIDQSTSNSLLRSTSSIRYKRDVAPLTMEDARKLLDLEPVTYRSRAEADDQSRRWYGFIAEDVAEVEPRLVNYGRLDEGGDLVPDGVQYERVVVLATMLLKNLDERVAALEAV